jgi:hypothetical protein
MVHCSMTDPSKFSSITYNQVIRPKAKQRPTKATQQLEVGTQNSDSSFDKENVHTSTPVSQLLLLFYDTNSGSLII